MSRLTYLSRTLCLGLLLFGAGSMVRAQEAKATSRGERLIHDYFRRETQRISEACLADIKTREDWESKRPELHRQFLDMLGLWPLPPRTDLRPVIMGRFETAD